MSLSNKPELGIIIVFIVRPRRRDATYLQTQLLIAQKEEAGIQLQAKEFDLMAVAADLDDIEKVNANCILMANLEQASTSSTQTDNAPVYDSDGSAEGNSRTTFCKCWGNTCDHESLFHNLAAEVEKVNSVNRKMKVKNAALTTELARYKNQERCFEISQEKYDKLERCYQQSVYQEQCLSKKINALHLSSGKQITALNEEISNLTKQLSKEKSTVSSLREENKRLKSDFKIREDELLDKQIQLENKVSEQKDTTRGTSTNTKFAKQSILGIPPSSSRPKLYVVTPLPKSTAIPKVSETNDLSNQVTSNSVPSSQELKVMENDNVIAPGMFRIDPCKTARKDNFVPNKPTKASIRINPITVSQPHVIIKKAINSDSNGFSSTGVDITTKTGRPQPRSNTKNDRVPSVSKSSRIMNKLAIRNDKSKIVCAMCKQCLITANHDACVLNYVNDMNSHRKKQKVNVSNIANQTKHKAQIWKPKNVGPKERLASPKPSKPRMHLRWSPTGKKFDHKGKIIASSDSNGDNACYPNMFMFLGTVRFSNDHVAAILGFDDLQWGNILITRVYFVEGLGYNLFSVGQFYDSDLE
ncbi:hypothetical protein Tco_0766926, partial [Tanacetum coccineum]